MGGIQWAERERSTEAAVLRLVMSGRDADALPDGAVALKAGTERDLPHLVALQMRVNERSTDMSWSCDWWRGRYTNIHREINILGSNLLQAALALDVGQLVPDGGGGGVAVAVQRGAAWLHVVRLQLQVLFQPVNDGSPTCGQSARVGACRQSHTATRVCLQPTAQAQAQVEVADQKTCPASETVAGERLSVSEKTAREIRTRVDAEVLEGLLEVRNVGRYLLLEQPPPREVHDELDLLGPRQYHRSERRQVWESQRACEEDNANTECALAQGQTESQSLLSQAQAQSQPRYCSSEPRRPLS